MKWNAAVSYQISLLGKLCIKGTPLWHRLFDKKEEWEMQWEILLIGFYINKSNWNQKRKILSCGIFGKLDILVSINNENIGVENEKAIPITSTSAQFSVKVNIWWQK